LKIAITGASGFIGRRLLKTFAKDGHSLHVLTRHAGTNLPPNVRLSVWDAAKSEPPEEALRDADAVIHLAGENIAQRWTDQAKRRIRESRVAGTRHLISALAKLPRKPAVLACGSAIGYYGSRGDETLTEASAPGAGFLPDLCVEWEREAQAAESLGIRVARIRTGVALDARGGALKKMLPAFRFGLAGKLGDGRQWMSWIHLEDLAALFKFVIEISVAGPINAVSPNPVANADFTRALARALHRPALIPAPAFALRLALGEMSEVLLASQRVIPAAAQSQGFRFRFAELGAALGDLLK
jgi:hypothetical protein